MVELAEAFTKRQKSPNTVRTYRRALLDFLGWLTEEGLELTALRPRHFDAYVAALTEQYEATKTVNLKLSAVKSWIEWMVRNEYLDPQVLNSANSVSGVAQSVKLPKLISLAEFQDLLCLPNPHRTEGQRDIAFLRLLYTSGVRLAEAVGLNIEDVSLKEKQAKVKGKGDKERLVYFDTETAQALATYLEMRGSPRTGPLFVNQEGNRISSRWMGELVRTLGCEIGRELHPHLFRHSFATRLYNKTGDLLLVSRLLGHTDPRTTANIYLPLAGERFEAVYRQAMDADFQIAPGRLLPVSPR